MIYRSQTDDQIEHHHLYPNCKDGNLRLPCVAYAIATCMGFSPMRSWRRSYPRSPLFLEAPSIQKFCTCVKTMPPSFENVAEDRTQRH